jgi:hypothetical protein
MQEQALTLELETNKVIACPDDYCHTQITTTVRAWQQHVAEHLRDTSLNVSMTVKSVDGG